MTVDLLFEFLLQLSVLVLQLGLGLQHSLQLSLHHLLLAGQLVHFQYQVFIHHVQSIPAGTRTRTFEHTCKILLVVDILSITCLHYSLFSHLSTFAHLPSTVLYFFFYSNVFYCVTFYFMYIIFLYFELLHYFISYVLGSPFTLVIFFIHIFWTLLEGA